MPKEVRASEKEKEYYQEEEVLPEWLQQNVSQFLAERF
jgi:hypothetical protein